MSAVNYEKIRKHITMHDGELELTIPVNVDLSDKVKIIDISMTVGVDDEDGDFDVMCGDLALSWEGKSLENTGGGDMGTLIMRGDDDEVGEVMNSFYYDNAYKKELVAHLVEAGFSTEAANDVSGSEWGMQDEFRASYDANLIGEEMAAAYADNKKAVLGYDPDEEDD